jgi:hypothetical protein
MDVQPHESRTLPAAGRRVVGRFDADHDPAGRPLERRAIQVGLRGEALRRFADRIVAIEDITPFVAEQRSNPRPLVPVEAIYPVTDPEVRRRLGLSASAADAPESG